GRTRQIARSFLSCHPRSVTMEQAVVNAVTVRKFPRGRYRGAAHEVHIAHEATPPSLRGGGPRERKDIMIARSRWLFVWVIRSLIALLFVLQPFAGEAQ